MLEKPAANQIIDESFKIISRLGEGGAATVFLAEQLGLQRKVAIKFLHAELLSDDDWQTRFLNEGKILASLSHANLIKCYAIGLWQGKIPYLVFEYLDGKTLRQLMRERKKLEWRLVANLATQICHGLEHAHQQGVMHRDLKPENILINNDKELSIKILDFGLARAWMNSQKLTQTGFLLGSLPYMSPEQCNGLHPDNRADIYSLSCILYECLSGNQPFTADNPMALVYKHLNQTQESLHKLGIEVPLSFVELINKGMRKEPESRFQSCAEMAESLEQLADEPDNKQKTSYEYANNRERKGIAIAIAIVLLAIAIFIVQDPGYGVLVVEAAKFMPKSKRADFLEREGDSFESRKRNRAAVLLYLASRANLTGEQLNRSFVLSSKIAKTAIANDDRAQAKDAIESALAGGVPQHPESVTDATGKSLYDSARRIAETLEILSLSSGKEKSFHVSEKSYSELFERFGKYDFQTEKSLCLARTTLPCNDWRDMFMKAKYIVQIAIKAEERKDFATISAILQREDRCNEIFSEFKLFWMPLLQSYEKSVANGKIEDRLVSKALQYLEKNIRNQRLSEDIILALKSAIQSRLSRGTQLPQVPKWNFEDFEKCAPRLRSEIALLCGVIQAAHCEYERSIEYAQLALEQFQRLKTDWKINRHIPDERFIQSTISSDVVLLCVLSPPLTIGRRRTLENLIVLPCKNWNEKLEILKQFTDELIFSGKPEEIYPALLRARMVIKDTDTYDTDFYDSVKEIGERIMHPPETYKEAFSKNVAMNATQVLIQAVLKDAEAHKVPESQLFPLRFMAAEYYYFASNPAESKRQVELGKPWASAIGSTDYRTYFQNWETGLAKMN